MIRTIPLHQIQYKDKYKKILEIKKKNKNIETQKDCKKVKGNSQSLKYYLFYSIQMLLLQIKNIMINQR